MYIYREEGTVRDQIRKCIYLSKLEVFSRYSICLRIEMKYVLFYFRVSRIKRVLVYRSFILSTLSLNPFIKT